ncbi:MAG TPA: hypothetical protein VFW98_02265 [Gemmatimonadaceae bacterium]|nr:hypothetical protein [Gemmatimonadaceae bacterium]
MRDTEQQSWHRRVDANWPGVRITHAEVEPPRGGGESRPLLRAAVELGTLLPADVQVEAAGSSGKPTETQAVRMWSAGRYREGVFVFEATVHRQVAGSESLVVQVRPARGYDLPPVAAPLDASAQRARGGGPAD